MSGKANYPLFLLQNGQHKPSGGMYGGTYSDVYVVAAATPERAKAFAAERSGFEGWEKSGTTCKRIGTSGGRKEKACYPTNAMRDIDGIH